MEIIAALIGIPLVTALLLLVLRNDTVRTVLVITSVVLMSALAVLLTLGYLASPEGFVVPFADNLHYVTLGTSLACCVYIIYRGIRDSNRLVLALAGIQAALVLFYELALYPDVAIQADLYVDQFAIIMALIIAFIGGGICVYALSYMRDHQDHLNHEAQSLATKDPSLVKEALRLTRDRRHIFFAILFLFLGAMFAVVFCNRLSWLLAGWEVLTLCSFVLIGYTRTAEATKNSFRAAAINVSGGVAFTLALILLASGATPVFELDVLVSTAAGGVLVLPVMLIAFACMTKAAQMPFQSWLLGAMVAPTPVSALLHSATMVKAGVYILLKLAPALGWTIPGSFVLIIGGLTFLGCTALSISQSNAKRVLAYSTVANLGLIACCAGIGTPEAAWAGIFLLVFHAAAKALLFCCVGTAEHHLGSRDIERLDNIFVRMPWIASCLALGMMAMFIAPFGMLVSKWATIVSIAQSGHFELLFILAFGSAMTFVVWAKWLGKVLAIGKPDLKGVVRAAKDELFSLTLLAFLLVITTLGLPYLSEFFVVPYLMGTGLALGSSMWESATNVLGSDNLIIMSIIFMAMLALLAVQLIRKRPTPNDTVYLAGVGTSSEDRSYQNSLGEVALAGQRNWYMDKIFGEGAIGRQATIMIAAVMALFFILGIVQELMML